MTEHQVTLIYDETQQRRFTPNPDPITVKEGDTIVFTGNITGVITGGTAPSDTTFKVTMDQALFKPSEVDFSPKTKSSPITVQSNVLKKSTIYHCELRKIGGVLLDETKTAGQQGGGTQPG